MANNSFQDLKKNSSKSIETLQNEINKLANPQQAAQDDEKFWKPSVDKVGNGQATIRFLPPPRGEDVPFVRIFSHGFKGPTGSWYIENSLTTLGQQDPVSEYNTQLWNSGVESDKDVARAQKRQLSFYSNIYVVKDFANPENDGKVFLYRYGKKIFDKIQEAMNPPFEGDEPINPFDFWEGANFKLRIKKVGGFWNYDSSEFEAPSVLASDKELEKIWKQQHSLQKLLDPSNFKSYDELKAQLNRVIGGQQFKAAQAEPTVGKMIEPPAQPAKASKLEEDEFDEIFKSLED